MHPVAWSELAKNVCYGLGAIISSIGVLKLFWRTTEQIERIPKALERAAIASEANAQMVKVLQEMHATQVETENTLAVMAREIGDVKFVLKVHQDAGPEEGNREEHERG